VRRAKNRDTGLLRKRRVELTLAFTAIAVVFGCLIAPAFLREVGALMGLMLGLPIAFVLASFLRWKTPMVAYTTVIGCVVLIAILISLHEAFFNPLVQIAMLLITGFAVDWFFPDDTATLDRSLCANCAYPIGVSPTCTECGRPVKPTAIIARNGQG
jgi:hypothetical protein